MPELERAERSEVCDDATLKADDLPPEPQREDRLTQSVTLTRRKCTCK